MKLREYFLCAKKTNIMNLFNNFFSSVTDFGATDALKRSQKIDLFMNQNDLFEMI